jgi:hypothetical protein
MSPHHASSTTAARADQQGSAEAPVPSRWLGLARAGWAVAALLALGIYVASLPGDVLNVGRNPFSGRGIAAPAGLVHTVILVTSLILFAAAPVCLGLAGLLVWRKPGDLMVLFVSFYLLLYGIVWVGPLDALAGLITDTGADSLHSSVNALHPLAFWWGTLTLLALFPTGRFVPSWTRWLVLLATLTAPLLVAITVQWFQALPNLWLLWPTLLYMSLTFTAAGYAQVYRYRHVSRPTERQQTKWAVSGLVVAVLLIQVELVLFTILFFRWPPHAALPGWTLGFGVLHTLDVGVVPLTLTVAVLHYRVFDIDVLIRRTLVYATLTVILGAVYVAGVLGAQAVVQALTGQTGQQPVFIVASTLLVAALFTPLRRRLQAGIDRRFYRRKYDAARTLAAFGATLRTETDLEQLSAQLMAVVQETMQPAHVSLWLRPPGRRAEHPDQSSRWPEAVRTTVRASAGSEESG